MDLMQLFATVVAVLFHPGSKTNGQMICRRGRERPCYKVSHIVQDGRQRPTFEDARQSCGLDGGQLLSIETESEQRLIERFIQQLQAGDADYWIVLRHGPQHNTAVTTSPGCPSHYYWLDGSKAKIRNWHWNKPSCDGEKCVVLYDWPSALPDEGAGFKWNNDDCNSKNSVVCKYPEEKVPVFTDERNMTHAAPSVRPSLLSTTESTEKTGKVQPESSVSFSDDSLHLSYILYGTIPAVLLLLFAAVGFFCYRHHGKRRKTETGSYSSRTPPWMSTASTPCPIQGPYAFSDITKLPPTVPHSATDNRTKIFCAPLHDSQCDEYENVVCTNREIGFVTNDIYETCRSQNSQTGWVDNEIYA